ncbi:condensation domain-containing protein [Streptantibioticus parmotrematis]|uniref:condensation domain-containing protein n=1 Tax=Streptantibioticus parmotrematis TaxID=2873249 RepID=UPI0033FFBF45
MGTPQHAVPLSVGQEAMWIAWELEPDQLTHIIPLPFLLRGDLDTERLRQAVRTVGEAYPQLRARVERTADGPALTWQDAPGIPVTERTVDTDVTSAVRETWQVPFDLRTGPLARVYVLRGPDWTVLLFAVHHLVFDGASVLLMLDAFRRAYEGAALAPDARADALTAFARRTRELADTAAGDALRAYWTDALRGGPPAPVLPAKRDEGDTYTMVVADVPSDLAADLRSRAAELECSYFTVLLAAYFVLLRRHSATDDVTLSIPSHGRTDPALRDAVGYFVNPLPLRYRLSDTDRYADVVRGLRSAVRERLRHAELPLASIMRAAGLTGPEARVHTHQSLFQYWDAGRHETVDVQNLTLRSDTAECVGSLLDMESTAGYTLAVMVREDSGGTHVLWKDPTGSVGPAAVTDLADDYLAVLKTLAADPDGVIVPVLPRADAEPVRAAVPTTRTAPAVDGPASSGEAAGSPGADDLAAMAGVWEEVLMISGVTPRDSFFELGGHSLLAETLTLLAGERFGRDIPVRDLFSHPRLDDFTRHVLSTAAATAPEPQAPTAAPADASARELPASSFQRRIWLIERDDDAARGNVCLAWRTDAGLDAGVLGAALEQLVGAHEILRTRFLWHDGELTQDVTDTWRPVVEEVDLNGAADADAAIGAWLAEAATRRFDLESGRLLRVALADLGSGEQALLLCVHHLVVDGESVPILLAELERCHAAVLAGREVTPPAVQYRDFVAAQSAERRDGTWERDLRHWSTALAGAPAHLDVPARADATEEGSTPLRTGDGLMERLAPVQAEHGVSWFIVAATALAVALHRWSGQDDLTFEVPLANRGHGRGPLADVLGPCLNTVVLRSALAPGAVVGDVLRRMRETALDGFEHGRVPFDEVVSHLDPERRPGRTPFADVILNMNSRTKRRTRLGAAELTPVFASELQAHDKQFGMTLTLTEQDGTVTGTLAHRGELITTAGAAELADDIARLLTRFGDSLDHPALPGRPADA